MKERSLRRMFLDLFAAARWYGLGLVLRQLVAFFLLPLYTRHLSPASLGVLSIVGMAQLFLVVLSTLGLTPAMFRLGADPDVVRRFGQGNILSTALLGLALWSGALAAALFVTAGLWSQWLFGDPVYAWAVRWLALIVVSESLGMGCFAGNVLRLNERAPVYALLSVVQVAAQMLLAYYLIAQKGRGVEGALIAMVAGSASVAFLALWLVRKDLKGRFNLEALQAMLRYSIPLIPGLLATGVLDVADRYILRLFLGLGAVGLYEAAYRIGKLVNFVLLPFGAALPPLLYSLGDTDKSRTFLARVATAMLVLSLGTAAFISIFAREITTLITGPEYARSWTLVPWIAFGTAAFFVGNVFTGGLHFSKKTGSISAITLIFAAITITLCVVTIPFMGILGPAVTTLVTFGGMAIVLLWRSQRSFPAPYDYRRMVTMVFLAMAVSLVALQFSSVEKAVEYAFIKVALFFLISVSLFALLFRAPEKRALGAIVKSRLPVEWLTWLKR